MPSGYMPCIILNDRKRLTSGNASNDRERSAMAYGGSQGRYIARSRIISGFAMSHSAESRRKKLPANYASFVMPFVLSIMMTFVVSLIATAKNLGLGHPDLAPNWMSAWGISWLIAFPVLLLILPLVRKIVAFACERP
jgi:hypothetical protein